MLIMTLSGNTCSRVCMCCCDVEDPTLFRWSGTLYLWFNVEPHLIPGAELPFIYYGNAMISVWNLQVVQLYVVYAPNAIVQSLHTNNWEAPCMGMFASLMGLKRATSSKHNTRSSEYYILRIPTESRYGIFIMVERIYIIYSVVTCNMWLAPICFLQVVPTLVQGSRMIIT